MAFALTKYIYPLEAELALSELLNFTFDNPRTDEEIELVERFITPTIEDALAQGESIILPLHKRAAFSIYIFKENLKEKGSDSYTLKYYSEIDGKSIIRILAETWIIIRLKDSSEFDDLMSKSMSLLSAVYSKAESEYSKSYNELADYCHLVSLLSNGFERYHGESFLLSNHPYEIFSEAINEHVPWPIESHIAFNNSFKYDSRYPNWHYWTDGLNSILSYALKIDSLMKQDAFREKGKPIRVSQKQTPKQKLFHIGRLLKTSYEHFRDPELMLLLQVSIIEYLITRNPDTNKFNVEDSISKQFKLKCAILVHIRDQEYDLLKLNNELSEIYSQRSDLAHGNYREAINIDQLFETVALLYKFNEHVLNVFISDRALIDYLKDN